jgi:very-short-patch-repair endonuclease
VDARLIGQALKEVEASSIHPLDPTASTGFLKSLAVLLSPDGEFIEEGPVPSPGPEPRIVSDPVLLLRTRSLGFARTLADLLEDVDQRLDFSSALLSIVGDHAASELVPAPLLGDTDESSSAVQWLIHQDQRILFSKPANEDQLHIASRLAQQHSVVVQGPPGTGKTHTIANLIGHLLAEGKSVLVTSHTDKALRVVRQQVVDQLQPLCVSVLASEADSREQLKQSITAILHRLSRDDAEQLQRQASRFEQQRGVLLGRLSELDHALQNARTDEYRDVIIAGEAHRPSDAARLVARGANTDSWVPAPVTLGAPLPLAPADLVRLYTLNAETSADIEHELAGWLPDRDHLPSPQAFASLVSQLDQLEARDLRRGHEYWIAPAQPSHPDELNQLAETCARTAEPLHELPAWRLAVLDAGNRGGIYSQPWESLIALIERAQEQVAEARELLYRHGPELRSQLALAEQMRLLREILDYVERGGKLNFFALNVQHRDWKDFLPSLAVSGRPPETAEHFRALLAIACVLDIRSQLVERWRRQVTELDGPSPDELGTEPEATCAQYVGWMRWASEWTSQSWAPLEMRLRSCGLRWDQVVELVPPRPGPHGPLLRLRDAVVGELPSILAGRADQLRWEETERQRQRLAMALMPSAGALPAAVSAQLRTAVETRDTGLYLAAYERLEFLARQQRLLSERETLISRLDNDAPAWAGAIRQRRSAHVGSTAPGAPDVAWRWRQLNDELERRALVSLTDLEHQRAETQRELRRVTADLIESRAWAAQLRRVQGSQKQALVGWSMAIAKIGKGTGKYAALHRAEAQRLMTQCREAVPVWIMSLARVADNFNPSKTRFDVVIIDEASQSDVMGLLAVYLGNEVVVVGDDEQVSPDAVGIDFAQIQPLIDTYLTGIPLARLYDPQTSIYDLSKAAFGGNITLREHFRCVPEIIQFSNHLSYNGIIMPLRDASNVMLKPHVVPYRVDGWVTGRNVNEEEARQIAALVAAASEQPEYAGKSFGVISLLGDDQAVWIDRILRQHLDPMEAEARRLRCGNPAQFQGDERDVIWLSMVDSPGSGPLALRTEGPREMYKKRYNVAASRARDQLWVVYSLDPSKDLKQGDIRRRLLEFALDPGAVTRELHSAETAAESEFERQVLVRLVQAGYRVMPQYWVGYYRIDIVVEGGGKRLAVECDGDQYHHTPEQIASDLERQAILERLGWQFVRIRGSLFFRDPERAMAPVFDRLQELEIPPEASNSPTPETEGDQPELLQRVIRRAREIRAEWEESPDGPSLSTWTPPAPEVSPPVADRMQTPPDAPHLAYPDSITFSVEQSFPMDSSLAARPSIEGGIPSQPTDAQSQPPGNALDEAAVRQRLLDDCLRVLRDSRPMSARELVTRLRALGIEADKRLVNSVLCYEGSRSVERDATGKYRATAAYLGKDGGSGSQHQLTGAEIVERWKSGGIIRVPAFSGWEVEARDQGHNRGFLLMIRRVGDLLPLRVERTAAGTRWDDARAQAVRLITTAAENEQS